MVVVKTSSKERPDFEIIDEKVKLLKQTMHLIHEMYKNDISKYVFSLPASASSNYTNSQFHSVYFTPGTAFGSPVSHTEQATPLAVTSSKTSVSTSPMAVDRGSRSPVGSSGISLFAASVNIASIESHACEMWKLLTLLLHYAHELSVSAIDYLHI